MTTESTLQRGTVAGGDAIKTYTDTGGEHIQSVGLADKNGDQAGLMSEHSWYDSTAAEQKSENITTGVAGKVWEATCIVDPTVSSERYLFVFDATTATGNPIHRALIPAGGQGTVTFRAGKSFSAGLTVALSTAYDSYSAASAEAVFHVEYE